MQALRVVVFVALLVFCVTPWGSPPVALALGLALSLLSTRMLEGLLFGVPPRDPITMALVTVAIAVAMLLAVYIPGRRAVRVDPITALRAE